MNDKVPRLMDAVLTAWTKCLLEPYGSGEYSSEKDGATDCNRFVNEVAEAVADYTALRGKLAEEIADFLPKSPDWAEVTDAAAQFQANAGALVIAWWRNPDARLHGHVCVVIPGRPTSSGRWHSDSVPRVANVSRPDLCAIDSHANFAFSEPPRYHVLKSTEAQPC